MEANRNHSILNYQNNRMRNKKTKEFIPAGNPDVKLGICIKLLFKTLGNINNFIGFNNVYNGDTVFHRKFDSPPLKAIN